MGTGEPIKWRIDVGSSRLFRVVVYAEVALFGGGAVLAVCGGLFLGVTSVLDGWYARLAYAVLLALIGGPLSLLYLLPVFVDADQRPPLSTLFPDETLAERYAAAFARRYLLAAVLGGAVAILVTFLLAPRIAIAAVVASLLLLPLLAGWISWGRVDPGAGTMRYNGRSVALDRVDGVRRIDLGSIAACWLRYPPGAAGLADRRLLVLDEEAADAVERIVAGSDHDRKEREPNRAVQGAFAFLSLCFLGMTALILVVESGSTGDPVLRWYVAITLGLAGTGFALAAVLGG